MANLKENVGFYFFIGFWSLYLALLTVLVLITRRSRKSKFFDKLFASLRSEEKFTKYIEEDKTKERILRIESVLFKNQVAQPQASKKEKSTYLSY